jgi:FlaA1/EpsC-like NDP-sugar epimerase
VERNGRSLVLRVIGLPRVVRKAIIITLDLMICLLAVWLAYWLRLGEWELFTPRVVIFAGIALATWIGVSIATRIYRSVVRFSGRHTVFALMRACMLMSLVLAILLVTLRIDSLPRTLSVIHPLVFFLAIVGQRVAIAYLVFDALHGMGRMSAPKRILIYGAGWAGQQLDASIRKEPGLKVVGFVDENEALRDNVLEGKTIFHTSDLELVLAMERIDEVFLAIPSAKRSVRRTIIERINQCSSQVRVRVLPTLSQIASGRVSISSLREVEIEELLGRDEVPPDPELMSRDIAGRRVLVTGAGGSIGSELCRQIMLQRPSILILAEQSEHALYRIDIELRETIKRAGLHCEIHAELVNVADQGQCERLLRKCRPDTVYHAAAYKHVPLVETNPVAGIRNNVLGTLNTCLASEEYGATKFILVSTDKAVRPPNVMGASKRACELIIQARAEAQRQTCYSSVRFGNVLGSSGSVIPLFREQIAAGGPVTITHRDATRYFMTIPEASQLVIQAGALAARGEILLLDMGQPVRILDLARLMVELSGLAVADEDAPDGDIVIEEIGLRPGEKLVEELLIGATSEGTAHPRIVKAREKMLAWEMLEPRLLELQLSLDQGDASAAIEKLKELVPEYKAPTPAQIAEAADVRTLQSRVAREMIGNA